MTYRFPDGVPGVSPRLHTARYGPGVISAPFGQRFVALLIDLVMSYLVAGLIARSRTPGAVSWAVFFVEYVFFLSLDGRTPGMRITGLRVARIADGRPPGLWNALIRTILLMLVIPAVIWDRDRRGLHDKATGTVVVATSSDAGSGRS